jgi:hypothetical protein
MKIKLRNKMQYLKLMLCQIKIPKFQHIFLDLIKQKRLIKSKENIFGLIIILY